MKRKTAIEMGGLCKIKRDLAGVGGVENESEGGGVEPGGGRGSETGSVMGGEGNK